MKKIITFITITILLTACGSSAKPEHVKQSPDTTAIQGFFKIGKVARLDSVFRVVKDTFRVSAVDSSAGKADLTWQRDTVYFIPILVDSVKKDVRWYGVRPEFVQEIHVKTIQ